MHLSEPPANHQHELLLKHVLELKHYLERGLLVYYFLLFAFSLSQHSRQYTSVTSVWGQYQSYKSVILST